jgi:glycosyltransferase involved in cell wall biosynthesis
MIILNILKHFHEKCEVQCETILHNGGHLAPEFQKHSDVPISCLEVPRKITDDLKKKISRVINREKGNRPILAVCNSMESRFISEVLAGMDIPVVSLVHELPSSYSEEDYQTVYGHSDKIIFPVHAVRDAADAKATIPAGKDMVLPQGLLKPDFGQNVTLERARQQIRNELSIPENAFMVLGCGTLDLRKGIDHFAAVARRVVETNQGSSTPIHFAWVGDGPRWTHSPYHYVMLDLEKSGAKSHVHFLGERADVEPYFVGSDAFLMSSRVDPFPCVIHEAMVTGLPVITFANSGGAQEAVGGGAGIVVPYADYEQTAGVIRMLSSQPEVAAGIRERSIKRVETRYQFEDYGDKLIDVCEALLNRQLRSEVRLYQHRAAA